MKAPADARPARATGPAPEPAWRRLAPGFGVFAFLAFMTCTMTWPIAASLDASFATHPDYFSNLWNIWWVRRSLFELGTSPFWTDMLFFPEGVPLALHTLSFANSVPGALLSYAVSLSAAFNLLTLAHFGLSAWAVYFLAFELTGHRLGSVLAGLVYAFCPFHYYYLPMINIVSMESLPLAALFFMRTYRDGGAGNFLGAAAATALTAVSNWSYLPYVALLAGTLTACGRLWAPEASFRVGALRVVAAGVAGGILVSPLALPLLSAALAPNGEHPLVGRRLYEGHDLLGFSWEGPPERWILAWPAAVGYSGLLLLALGLPALRRQKTWLIVLGASWLLGLGGSLRVGGVDTGVPLPYAALVELPVLGMLRRPDRMFLLLQLAFAVLCAYAWQGLAERIASRRLQGIAWGALAGAVALEFNGSPLREFPYPCSPYFAEIASDPETDSMIELPLALGPWAARYNHCQTVHGKKMPQGYVTSLAMTRRLWPEQDAWTESFSRLNRPGDDAFFRRLRARNIDLVVMDKVVPFLREPEETGSVVWKPFGWVDERLMPPRQTWTLGYRRTTSQPIRSALREALGEPIHEDAWISVYRVR